MDVLDGIWFRKGKLKGGDIEFQLMFHEDVGNWFVGSESTAENNARLKRIAEKIISGITADPAKED